MKSDFTYIDMYCEYFIKIMESSITRIYILNCTVVYIEVNLFNTL